MGGLRTRRADVNRVPARGPRASLALVSNSSVPPRGITREMDTPSDVDAVGVSLPVGFRATSNDDGFTLVVKQRPTWAYFLTVFALGWNGFMALWFTIAIASGAWMMALFGTLHAVVGFVVGYLALRGLLNRIELRVTRGALVIEHKPLPWPSPPPLARADIEQLYVRLDHSLRVNNRPVDRYELRLRETSGKERKLLIVDAPEQAQYLEREIERAFAIEDRRVASELPK